MRWIQRLLLFFVCFFSLSPAFAVLVVDGITLVSKQRVGRAEFEYTYQADITNTGSSPAQSVSATIASSSPDTIIVDDTLAFPDLNPGQSLSSSDTFSFRQDRRVAFDQSVLNFDFLAVELSVGNFILVNKRRVGRSAYEYDYQIELTNNGFTNAQAITATVTSNSAASIIIDGDVAFPDIAAGGVALSSDTITIRQDRTATFNPGDMVFDIDATPIAIPDVIAPQISFLNPLNNGLEISNLPLIEVDYSDDRGVVDTASLAFVANGQPLTVTCQSTQTSAVCTPTSALPEGAISLAASIQDPAGNQATAQLQFTIDSLPVSIATTAPTQGFITTASDIDVIGTVDPGVVAVSVNNVPATLSGGTFTATVPLREGKNMLVAVGTKASGRTGAASVDITRDIFAPIVRIQTPRDGFIAATSAITVTGVVNDIVDGGIDASVIVNGVQATSSAGSFVVVGLPLVRGPNTIAATATDAAGNVGGHSITVNYQPPVGLRLSDVGGNGQIANVGQLLPQPLVVSVKDDAGNPVIGRMVKFEVTRDNGQLDSSTSSGRMLQVPTNANGLASVQYTLGTTAGGGNNRVVASVLGLNGEIEFCATALPNLPDKIIAIEGFNQRGAVGQPLPVPLEVRVVDADGNSVGNVDVTFAVVQGNGDIDGAQTLVKTTGSDGIVRANYTLGLTPGVNNNVVQASAPGITGLATTFTASALAIGLPQDTRFSGVVMDNSQTPVPGAVVSIPGTAVSGVTDNEGKFLLTNVPVGNIHLHIDPSNSPRPETFPPLEFETIAIAGQNNTLGQSILIPPLDAGGAKVVGGSQDVTLTMANVPGVELTVFADSVTFPGGSKTGQLMLSQVHLDKVPMPPPNGANFSPPVWTIQPHGVQFDPPASIRLPNSYGLSPGTITSIYQFDHGLYRFVDVGKGTVTDDGLSIQSDLGFGVTRSGWGGAQPPPPEDTNLESDGEAEDDTTKKDPQNSCMVDFLFSPAPIVVNNSGNLSALGDPAGGLYSWSIANSQIANITSGKNSSSITLKGLLPGKTSATVNYICTGNQNIFGLDSATVDIVVTCLAADINRLRNELRILIERAISLEKQANEASVKAAVLFAIAAKKTVDAVKSGSGAVACTNACLAGLPASWPLCIKCLNDIDNAIDDIDGAINAWLDFIQAASEAARLHREASAAFRAAAVKARAIRVCTSLPGDSANEQALLNAATYHENEANKLDQQIQDAQNEINKLQKLRGDLVKHRDDITISKPPNVP